MSVYQNEKKFFFKTGTTRAERKTVGLSAEYIQMDERDPRELLAWSLSYSQFVQYFYQNNTPATDDKWHEFFAQDHSILLASILNVEIDHFRDRYKKLSADYAMIDLPEKRIRFLQEMYNLANEILGLFNEWYREAKQLNLTPLESELEQAIISKLKPVHAKVYSILVPLKLLGSHSFFLAKIMDLDPIWELEEVTVQEYSGAQTVSAIRDLMKQVFSELFEVLVFVASNLKELYKRSSQLDDHPPHTALFITFTQLFQHAKFELNKLTQRHLDFYYKEVLQLKKRAPVSDCLNVVFKLNKGVNEHLIPKGTELNAGQDAQNKPLIYTTENDLVVNATQVASIRTLFQQKENPNTTGLANLLVAPVANSADGQGKPLKDKSQGWPTLGESLDSHSQGISRMKPADLGYIVSSPILNLQEGTRKISLEFQFDPQSLQEAHEKICSGLENDDISPETWLIRNISHSFVFTFSGPKGWAKFDQVDLQLNEEFWENGTLRFIIQMDPSDPALVRFNPKLHHGCPACSHPVIRIGLDQENYTNPYPVIRKWKIQMIRFLVEAQEITDLVLENPIGKLPPGKPFPLFGALPAKGAYLLVTAPELEAKHLTNLQLNLNWLNLPDEAGTLENYYREYEAGITEASFKIRINGLTKDGWIPESTENQLVFNLFEKVSFPKNEALTTNSRSSFPIESPDQLGQSNHLRIELIAPDYGFGNRLYEKKFVETVSENARRKKQKDLLPLPRPPFAPIVKQFSLSYQAEDEWRFSFEASNRIGSGQGAAFIQCPFGFQKAYEDRVAQRSNMAPEYDRQGYLILGLKDLAPPQNLTLFFKQKTKMLQQGARLPQNLKISYTKDNDWVQLPDNALLSNSTRTFTNTGILKLEIPADISTGGTLLPDDLHWIRIGLDGLDEIVPYTIRIDTQAVNAIWQNNGSPTHLLEPLPTGSVKGLVKPDKLVEKVEQPSYSFFGQPQELNESYYVRVSERLRHKERLVNIWDYEHMVLQRFPYVNYVRCINHSDPDFPDQPRPGNVLMVVIPRLRGGSPFFPPSINFDTLETIRAELERHSSPLTRIKVINPRYEWIRVLAQVVFKKGKDEGFYQKKLNQDLMRMLSPWFYDATHNLTTGAVIYKDNVISFIENLSYVSYIHKLKIEKIEEHKTRDGGRQLVVSAGMGQKIEGSYPWSVLISHQEHLITAVDEFASPGKPLEEGIGTMVVNDDFYVGLTRAPQELKFPGPVGLQKEEKIVPGDKRYYLLIKKP